MVAELPLCRPLIKPQEPDSRGLRKGATNGALAWHCLINVKEFPMSKEQENKASVGRWFKEFWGNPWNPKVVEALGTQDILLQYSLHAPRRGREDVRDFMIGFREAFPDLNFRGAAD